MRLLTLFLLFIACPLYSQWQQLSNVERLNTGKNPIRDIVITPDNKYIYTLDDSNYIKKWDYETGDIKDSFHVDLKKFSGNVVTASLFLSLDAQSYCITYGSLTNCINIYDLNNNTLIDSVFYSMNMYDFWEGSFGNTYANYNSSTKTLFFSNFFSGTNYPPYSGGFNGHTVITTKMNDSWSTKVDIEAVASQTIFNLGLSKIFCILHSQYWTNFYYPPRKYASGSGSGFYLFDLDNYRPILISSHFVSDDADGHHSESGIARGFSSIIYSKNNSKVYLTEKNKLHNYDFQNTKFVDSLTLVNESPKNSLILINSSDSNYFFSIKNNKVDVYSFNDLQIHQTLIPDSVKTIRILRYTKDEAFLNISDGTNYIYRMIDSNIFRFKALFSVSDTTILLGDSVKFINLSYGNIDSLEWHFGDGVTSNKTNPYHTYNDTGYYDIKLRIWGSGKTDSLIKHTYIKVIPTIIPDFNYTLNGTNPAEVSFVNKSKGAIDSLIWDFGDSVTTITENPLHNYLFSGSYYVTLKIFSNGIAKSITKLVTISFPDKPDHKNKFTYEYIDTNHSNSVAVKGYELEGNYLVYHIVSDSTTYQGAFKNLKPEWELIKNTNKDYFIRRDTGLFTYLDGSLVYNIDAYGNLTDQKPFKSNINSVRSSKGCVTITRYVNNNNYQPYYDYFVLNRANDSLAAKKLFEKAYNEYNNSFVLRGLIANQDSEGVDYAFSIFYNRIIPGQGIYSYNAFEINRSDIASTSSFNDFIRLNDSTLVFINKSLCFLVQNEHHFFKDSSTSIKTSKVIFEKDYKPFNFNSLQKINDTSLVAAGNYQQQPAFVILNNKGEIIDSAIMENKKGNLYFVSITSDSNLLFSGYRYKYFNSKSPYFIKASDSLIQVLLTGSYKPPKDTIIKKDSVIKQDTLQPTVNSDTTLTVYAIFPNPANKLASIKFSLTQLSIVKFQLFDNLGFNIFSSEEKTYNKGINLINIDLSPYPSGWYFYRLEIDGNPYYGKLTYIKD